MTSTACALLWISAALQSGPVSIWAPTDVPGNPSAADAAAVEVGVKFRSDVPGEILGIRFYKGAGNTGSHIGNLWSAAGANLASVTFANETADGWQQMLFAAPAAIASNTTYVASVFCPVGGYAATNYAFAAGGVDNGVLHALAEGVDGSNGVYAYGAASAFPGSTYQSTNYWVDVVFQPAGTTPPPSPPAPGPPAPARTEDHAEGLVDEKCSCGSTAGTGSLAGLSGLALLTLFLRRRNADSA